MIGIAQFVGVWAILLALRIIFGDAITLAFACGFILCALIAFWEAGAKTKDTPQ